MKSKYVLNKIKINIRFIFNYYLFSKMLKVYGV